MSVVVNLLDGYIHHARGRTRYKHLVAYREFARLARKLCHAEFREILDALAHVNLALRGVRAIVFVPFAKALSLVVAVPESAVEHRCQALVPFVLLLLGERAVKHALYGLLVAFHHGVDILSAARTALYLEHSYAGLHHAVDEAHRLQVFRAHYIFVVNLQLRSCLLVCHDVRAAAQLHALSAVCRARRVVKTQIALAADGHAQRAVAEHLYADLLARRSADVHLLRLLMYLCHLFHVQLTRQHHNVGKLRVELQRLDVAYVKLCRQVYLLAHLLAVGHHGHVARYHGRYAGLLGGVDNLVHQLDVVVIDDGVHRQISLHAPFAARSCNLAQVVNGERACRVSSHVQLLDAEINRVGTCLKCCLQALAAAHGRHYLIVGNVSVHNL